MGSFVEPFLTCILPEPVLSFNRIKGRAFGNCSLISAATMQINWECDGIVRMTWYGGKSYPSSMAAYGSSLLCRGSIIPFNGRISKYPYFFYLKNRISFIRSLGRRVFRRLVLLFMVWFISGSQLNGQMVSSGIASFYHDSLEGNRTASGEVFLQGLFTAAHKSLPFNTWVKVTDPSGLSVVVRVNDRLPRRSSRMIDLTTLAAEQLEMIQAGLKRVRLQTISAEEAWAWFIEQGFFHWKYTAGVF